MQASEGLAPSPNMTESSNLLARRDSVSGQDLSATSRAEQAKYSSPPPPSSSMTPPPSSQVSHPSRIIARTPSPTTPHLSSPPPTSKGAAYLGSSVGPTIHVTQDQLNDATVEELRDMVAELVIALREARTSAAHYKLQYNMLCIDSSEASNRMAVELAMAQREVDVLQQAEERRRLEAEAPIQAIQNESAANASLVHEMSRHCSMLQNENAELRDQVAHTKKVLEQREGQLASLVEENELLRGRIRKNREHVNGLLDYMHGTSPRSNVSTPHQTPRQRDIPRSRPSTGQRPFEALLLADKVLNQELATEPSTPTRAPAQKQRYGHSRGTHSMSSLPTTPSRVHATNVDTSDPRTPVTYRINAVPQSAPAAHFRNATRRRASNDSTISAPSANDGNASSDDDVPESSASQAATSMLRRTPVQRIEKSQSTNPGQPSSGGGTVQSKLFGRISKPGVSKPSEREKRKISGGEALVDQSPSKRKRLGEDVGLGIGGLGASSTG